jgi:hypothetical protein
MNIIEFWKLSMMLVRKAVPISRHHAKSLDFGVLALAGVLTMSSTSADADPLARYRWNARVLVVFAADKGDPQLARQTDLLASARHGMAERDLVVLEAIGSSSEAGRLRRQLGVPDGEFRAILVGKDGGAKLTDTAAIPPDRLFATIDAMPMRRQEMRQR